MQIGVDQNDQNKAQNKKGGVEGVFAASADELSENRLAPYSEVFGLQRFRECELIHGRWAMLATLGAIVGEATTGVSWCAAKQSAAPRCGAPGGPPRACPRRLRLRRSSRGAALGALRARQSVGRASVPAASADPRPPPATPRHAGSMPARWSWTAPRTLACPCPSPSPS